jgi:hypothetical protein
MELIGFNNLGPTFAPPVLFSRRERSSTKPLLDKDPVISEYAIRAEILPVGQNNG